MIRLNAELSRRENEIACLLAWGASKKEIAERLFISTRTVENTARSIYHKTGVQKATELCVWWFCTKYGVKTSLDPLKRAFVALLLLLIFLPYELMQGGELYRRTGRRAARTEQRAGRRKTDGESINFLDI